MKVLGIPKKLINMVRCTMNGSKMKVMVQNKLSEAIETNKGVKQGDSLSALLFNIALHVIEDLDDNGIIFNRSFKLYAYADDILIMGKSAKTTKEVFLKIEKRAKKIRLRVNADKTKYMILSRESEGNSCLKIEHYEFERVERFRYLGVMVTSNNRRV